MPIFNGMILKRNTDGGVNVLFCLKQGLLNGCLPGSSGVPEQCAMENCWHFSGEKSGCCCLKCRLATGYAGKAAEQGHAVYRGKRAFNARATNKIISISFIYRFLPASFAHRTAIGTAFALKLHNSQGRVSHS